MIGGFNWPAIRNGATFQALVNVLLLHEDANTIAFTKEEIIENVETLLGTRTEKEAREHFRLCSQSQWNYQNAKH